MSVAAHHNDWLSLVEVSGPFLALPVLVDALPGGLDKADRALTGDLWHAHAEWLDEDRGGAADPAVHRAWARYVVECVLGYASDVLIDDTDALEASSIEVPEHDTSLHATLAVRDPGATDDPPLLLIDVIHPDTAVLESSSGTGWSASPAERMEALLKATEARLGLVTNGEQWTLVHVAEGENTGFATWYASLWREEPLTLRAFTTLLGMRRFFAVAEHETLQALLDRSREAQQGVTTQLGKQVRRAIEILIQQIDRVDHDRNGRLLEGMTEQRLYEAAVTVMMRLIFLFYAEENDLLLLGDEFYDETYAASTLCEQLQATADENGEEILERFHDAWPRLLSTFRAVYAGVEHEQMRLPAYGGALFDPDRYPFLEGREPETSWEADPANPLPIDNRTVLHLLNAIQTLEVKVPGGGRENRPLSFRALDVEQIGHVYETLLDHAAKRADDWVFGLEGTKDKEPEVPLRELEDRVDDTKELVKYLKDETGRSAGALKRRVAAEEKAVYERWGHRWKPAFGGDEESAAKATKWGLLVREDSAESPVVVPPGHVYVTESEQRRSSGTHYTPRSLTEEIVTHTLEPLVYEGPAEGRDRSDWERRTPEEILDLKVCDPACGSGAFLVQACRYLAERLVEAWEEHSSTEGPDGHALPVAPEERLIVARRYIADRCLYGVDINPLATEMAKLSLWLITLQRNRPFTFLDHAIRTGDSLLGVTDFETLETFGVAKGQTQLWSQSWAPQLKAAREAREELRAFSVIDAKDADHKRSLLNAAATELEDLSLVADAITGVQLASSVLKKGETESLRREVGGLLELAFGRGDSSAREAVATKARQQLDKDLPIGDPPRLPLHWVLEFPEVVVGARRGFDAFIGNPPFVGGRKISGAMGAIYRSYLVVEVANGSRGSADYVAYFVLRAAGLASVDTGTLGFIATNTLAQGDTREVGLDALADAGWQLTRGTRTRPWPGAAGVEIATVWLWRGQWHGEYQLDGRAVAGLTTELLPQGRVEGLPYRLNVNKGRALQGSNVLGSGFVLTPEVARRLIQEDPRNAEVVRPYFGGKELNDSTDGTSPRWVIDFREMAQSEAESYEAPFAICLAKVKPDREEKDGEKYPRMVYQWWKHWNSRPELYRKARTEGRESIVVLARVSSTLVPLRMPSAAVYSEKVVVFPDLTSSEFGVLSSQIHTWWAVRYSVTLGTGVSYTPTDCFETFPMPDESTSVQVAVAALEQLRHEIMRKNGLGLTRVYSMFHSPETASEEVATLRDAHVELDAQVLRAYGWNDLSPIYDFRETRLGTRFTFGFADMIEVNDRLLLLNHAVALRG